MAALEKRLAALEKLIAVDPSGNVIVKATSFVLESSASIKLKASGALMISSAGTLEIKGTAINMNGGRPLARVGDTVVIAGPTGTIATGNPSVLG